MDYNNVTIEYENNKNYVPDEQNSTETTAISNGKSQGLLYPTLYVQQEGKNGHLETIALKLPDQDGPNIKLSSSVMRLEQLGLDDAKKQRPTPVSDAE